MKRLDDNHVKVRADMIGVHFDSITELLEYKMGSNNPNVARFNKHIKSTCRTENDGGEWIGKTNNSNKDVINHALLGDPELYADLQEKIKQFKQAIGFDTVNYTQTIPRRKRKRVKSDQGDEVDIHAVYQGRTDKAWRSHMRVDVNVQHTLVTIMVDIHDTADYNCTDSFWRAAVAVHLANELQSAGKSVKIVVGGISMGSLKRAPQIDGHKINFLCESIVIKDYTDRLAPERLAAMTHLGFYRTFGFGAKAVQPYKLNEGLGYSVDTTTTRFPVHLQEEVDAGHTKVVLIPRVKSLQAAKEALKDAYAQMEAFTKKER